MYQACDGNFFLGCLSHGKNNDQRTRIFESLIEIEIKTSRSSSSRVPSASLESQLPPGYRCKSRSIFFLSPTCPISSDNDSLCDWQPLICVSTASFFSASQCAPQTYYYQRWKSRRTVKRVMDAYVDFSSFPLIELRTIICPVMLDTKLLVGQIVVRDCDASFVASEPWEDRYTINHDFNDDFNSITRTNYNFPLINLLDVYFDKWLNDLNI